MNNSEEQNPSRDETVSLINYKFQQLQDRQKNIDTVILYQPGSLTKENRYVMLARAEIEYALRFLAQTHFSEETAKHLYTGYEWLLTTLVEGSIIDENLSEDVRDFYTFSAPIVRESISHQTFLKIQYISSDILERLYQLSS